MTSPFDPDELRAAAPQDYPDPATSPRHRPGEKFIRGPLPVTWFNRAAALKGQALWVGLLLWGVFGCTGRATVRFSLSQATSAGISERTVNRAIHQLERAGLIRVAR